MKSIAHQQNKSKYILSVFLLLIFSNCLAKNYTWTGVQSTDWGDDKNWSPYGIPAYSDTVTIVTGSNNVYLSAKTEVKKLTITSGTMNLQGNELIVNSTSNFNGGTVNNGLVTLNSTTHVFAGTTFGAKVYVLAQSAIFNGSVFNDSLTFIKVSSKNPSTSKGGNTFNGAVMVKDSSIGSIVLSDSLPDIFNSTLTLYNTSTASIYIANKGTGNQFNGTVTFSGPNIYSNYYGTATYSGNIVLNTASGNIFFGYGEGSCTQSVGKKISIGASGFSAGQLYLRNFNSLDSSSKISLTLSGSAKVYFETGSKFKDTMVVNAPLLYLNGTKFYNKTSFEIKGNTAVTSSGGCYFGKAFSFTNSMGVSEVYSMGNSYPDTFAMTSVFVNKAYTFSVNKGLFLGKVTIDNNAVGGEGFFIATTGDCKFKDSLYIIADQNLGMRFGQSGGTTTIDSTGVLCFKTGCGGNAIISNLTKLGSAAQVFNAGSNELTLGPNNVWNGAFNFYGKHIALNGNTFNTTTSISVYPTSTYSSTGGNVFNGSATIQDSSSTSHSMYLAASAPDDYNSNVTFIQKGSGVNLYPSYTKNSTVAGNLICNGVSAKLQVGGSGGKLILDGTGSQTIGRGSSMYAPEIKKLQLNKSSGSIALTTPLIIYDSLLLTNGVIHSDTTNFIQLNHGGLLAGGSDSSFVDGPMKKNGNVAFTFPLGSSTLAHGYHPLSITAPTSSSDGYKACYYPTSQTTGTAIDSTIDNLNGCQYWTLNRTAGTSKVKVTLSWNHDSCETISPSKFRVTGWNGSIWKDLGKSVTSGDSTKGMVQSVDSLNSISTLTLAFLKCSAFRKTISHVNAQCKGGSDGSINLLAKGGTTGYSYSWQNAMGVNSQLKNLRAGKYYFNIGDSRGCALMDSIEITEPDSIIIGVTITEPLCTQSNGSILITPSGGAGYFHYYWMHDRQFASLLSGIPSGNYSVLVTDTNGCNVMKDIIVQNSNGPGMNIISQTNLTCYGSDSGSVEIEGADGKPPFRYQWSNFISDTLPKLERLRAGIYPVRIANNIGCVSVDTIEITKPDTFDIELSVTNTPCGTSSGEISVSTIGGLAPHSFFWSTSLSADSILTGLPSGIDTVTVTDANGCSIQKVAEVLSSSGFNISAVQLTSINCYPDSAASAEVIVTGGNSPFVYDWQPDGINSETAFELSPIPYSITVVDANGCRARTTLDIDAPLHLELYLEKTDATSDTTYDGSIQSLASGGVPPYSFLWSTSETTPSIDNLGEGSYTLTVTDANGCSVTKTAVVRANGINCYFCLEPSCGPFDFTGITGAVKDVVGDFGAVGDGTNDDHCAFEAAAAYFKSLDPTIQKTLNIPYGIYRVGRQEASGGLYLQGKSVLCFDNLANLTIQGIRDEYGRRPVLMLNDCMKFGTFDYPSNPENRLLKDNNDNGLNISCTLINGLTTVTTSSTGYLAAGYFVFDPVSTPSPPHPVIPASNTIYTITNSTTFELQYPATSSGTYTLHFTSDCLRNPLDYDQLASIGDMIHFSHCNDIQINDIELDGNIENTRIGGGHSDGIQASYDGIWLNACNNSQLNNLFIHHFGHDGIYLTYNDCYILDHFPSSQNTCYISNCQISHNSRNGMSWSGGKGLIAYRTKFEFNGISRLSMNPGAGLDIEYENSNINNSNGLFTECVFRYNKNYGLISAAQQQGSDLHSSNYRFLLCTFSGSESGTAIYPNARQMEFKDCYSYGYVNNPYVSYIPRWVANDPNGWNYVLTGNRDNVRFINTYFGEEWVDENEETKYFSQTPEEVVNISGTPSPCPTCSTASSHNWMVAMASAKRVYFTNCVLNTNFTNNIILLGTNTPSRLRRFDYNLLGNNTRLINTGLNASFCDYGGLYSINNTIISDGNVYFWAFDNARNLGLGCNSPYEYYTGAGFNLLTINSPSPPAIGLGSLIPQYTLTSTAPFPGLCYKYTDPTISHPISSLYWAPCKSEIAGPPSCLPPFRKSTKVKENYDTLGKLSLSPNPGTNVIFLENLQVNSNLEIVDALGNICISEALSNDKLYLNIQSLNAGLYLVRNGSKTPIKFIKQ